MRRFFLIVPLLALLLLVAAPSYADLRTSEEWFSALGYEDRIALQTQLAVLGYYDRLIDAEFGPGTFRALSSFESNEAQSPDGVLSENQRLSLTRLAAAKTEELGLEFVENSELGMQLALPTNIVGAYRARGSNSNSPISLGGTKGYFSSDELLLALPFNASHSDIGREGVTYSDLGLKGLYSELLKSVPTSERGYAGLAGNRFVISGNTGSSTDIWRYYITASDNGTSVLGIFVIYHHSYDRVGSLISVLNASLMAAVTGEGVKDQPFAVLPPEPTPTPKYASGTGFFFNAYGMIATNFHVAGQCESITVVNFGTATLLKGSGTSDLAVIKVSGASPASAVIRSTPPSLAESVLLMGYPLSNALNSSLNVSTGIVSAETGYEGDADTFTTNAGIQPGNSGGPLLDSQGNVLGVAVAKLDERQMLADAGTTGSNVGFGIKNTVLADFLKEFDHSLADHDDSQPDETPQAISGIAKEFTVQIVCEVSPS